jgi:HAD superfamily hydrolase (TIGR01490 family)
MSEYVNVASSGPSAAFFDLDRTLISGSSAFTLALQARKAGLIPNVEFVRDAAGAISFQLFGADDDTTDAVKARILKAVAGMRQSDLQALNVEVLPRLLAKLRPEARRLLDRHRHAGRDTFIVSAAPQEIVEPLAHSFGMTSGIGTRSHVVDGRYTGELDGPFCYGDGKVEAMVELANWNGYDLNQCYAYSDSASDLPMLEAVGPSGGGQPRRQARTPRPPQRLADRDLQPADQVGRAAHRGVGRHGRDRRCQLRRRRSRRRITQPEPGARAFPDAEAVRPADAGTTRVAGSGRRACRSSPRSRPPRRAGRRG